MATTEAWMDFEQIKHSIKYNTVDKLKQILSGLNEECGTHFSKSGKKQDIIDRIVLVLDQWRTAKFEDKWMKAKGVVYQVRASGIYTPTRNQNLTAILPSAAQTTYDPPKPNIYSSSMAGTSSLPHYDPYAPPRRPAGISAPLPSTSTSSVVKTPAIRFRESPFFTVDQAVSSIVECPESTSPTDRRQQSVSFTLNAEQTLKIKSPGSKYQLRLFCTSSIFFAGIGSFRTNPVSCPVEFPPTCEVRVNNVQITANLKGLKKKPGTAPPPDIGRYARTTGANRVEMVYVNSQQPVQTKKFYIVVMLVEGTTINVLISNLKTQNFRSSHDIRQRMILAMSQDEDIVAGPQKMSLKCPLTFVRITTPCRSSKCVHPQCFDATSWFTMMEQTTTWLCPVCEQTLDHKDLIMDGYFDEILQKTPESVEDVMVEADGQWHTVDNKYGSLEWKIAHPPSEEEIPKKPSSPKISSCNKLDSTQINGKDKALDVEVFVLDSDDEDEGRVKRELSPTYTSSASRSFDGTLPSDSQSTLSQATRTVIDLTLDDSDDEQIASTSVASGKRKADEVDRENAEPQWKRGKIDMTSRILPVPRGGPHSINGIVHSSPANSQHPAHFSGNSLGSPLFPSNSYNPLARNANASNNPALQLPPLSSAFQRPGSNSMWRT